jgi:hypothetical protein
MSFFGTIPSSLTKPQMLAIGIGDPNNLSLQELRTFCEIVYPVESKCAYFVDRAEAKQEAQKYLQRATGRDLLRNLNTLPTKDLSQVDARIKECSVEIANIDVTLNNLIEFLRARKTKSENVDQLLKEANEIRNI